MGFAFHPPAGSVGHQFSQIDLIFRNHIDASIALAHVLARNNPVAIPFVALLFAYLQIGANIVGTTTDVPSEFVMVIQAIIILLVAATLFLDSFRKRAVVRLAQQNKEV